MLAGGFLLPENYPLALAPSMGEAQNRRLTFLKRRKVNAVFGHRGCANNAQRSPRAAKQRTVLF